LDVLHLRVEDADAIATRAAALGGTAVFRETFGLLDAAALPEAERGGEPSWLTYFIVERTDDAIRKAEQLGGQRVEPSGETYIGRSAVIADLQAARVGVLQR
jgi:predicted enzyme related to lactoylglutathione lyase